MLAVAAQLQNGDSAVDILVDNAGTFACGPAIEHTEAVWDHVLVVNLTSQFVLAQAIGAAMLTRESAKMIFTASLLSSKGAINVVGYTVAISDPRCHHGVTARSSRTTSTIAHIWKAKWWGGWGTVGQNS